jgi:dipeptidyl-peptidase-4
MPTFPASARLGSVATISAATFVMLAGARPLAQDRLPSMPGFAQFSKMRAAIQGGVVVSGAVTAVVWSPDATSVTYLSANKAYRFDLATMKATETATTSTFGAGLGGRGAGRQAGPPAGGMEQEQAEMPTTPIPGCPQGAAARGRQADCVLAPDGKLKAFYRARNLWVANTDGSAERQVTTDGSEKGRIKNGTGSWVYGEELGQTTAIWWAPDSTRVGFYRFDESPVKDFYLQMNQTAVQDSLDVEAYPKAGAPNPIADVFVYDTRAAKTTRIDVRNGKPFDNTVVGHYVYAVEWSPDGTELLMNRTNRRQQIMEFVGCSPATGACRVIVHEEWLTGWTNNHPQRTFLADHQRFIWESERNGWRNFYLYDLTGHLQNPITTLATAEVVSIVKIDEPNHVLFYLARDGDNYMKQQLHRVNLDGTADVRLTDPAFNHAVASCLAGGVGRRGGGGAAPGSAPSCGISPDNKYFVDVYQTHDHPPATRLVGASGKTAAELAASDRSQMDQLGLKTAEQYTYLAADGKTTLYGQIQFPSTFDPAKKYPTLINVYGGPASSSNVPTENFVTPTPTVDYGFLVLSLSSRAAPGQGKRTLDSVYLKLGVTEMDDMALGIKALWTRPYFDKDRVGMYGTSYGGYTSATMILRHPEAVTVASASSPPTAWYNYDSIYTERYMWIPQENKTGYEAGSDMTYAGNLKGRLLLYYATADNNVHPDNSMQLVTALQAARKSFELQVGPDLGHSGVDNQRMMEFFIENLVIHPERILKS